MKSQIHENKKNRLLRLSKNLLMLLVAVLGTSAMVQAFPVKAKATSTKEVTMKKHKHNKAKKEQKAATATKPAMTTTPAPSSPKTK